MAADLSGPDPKTLWLDQEQEADPVTLDQIHALVRRYDLWTRRAVLAFPILLLVVGFFGADLWRKARDLIGHAMAIAFILGEAGTCFIAWRALYPARDPAEPAGAYLRRRLVRRLAYLRGGWTVAVLPLVPFIVLGQYVTFAHGRGPWPVRAAPSLIMAATLVFAWARTRSRARRIKTQLDELEGLMRR